MGLLYHENVLGQLNPFLCVCVSEFSVISSISALGAMTKVHMDVDAIEFFKQCTTGDD